MEKWMDDFPGFGKVVSRVTPTERGMLIQSRIAAVEEDDVIDVRMEGKFLVIRINSHMVQEQDSVYQRRINGQRMFTQSFYIPFPVDDSHIRTDWRDQTLTVFVPKREHSGSPGRPSPEHAAQSDMGRPGGRKSIGKRP
jgi:HSP20 family molecular chaperone IbpA